MVYIIARLREGNVNGYNTIDTETRNTTVYTDDELTEVMNSGRIEIANAHIRGNSIFIVGENAFEGIEFKYTTHNYDLDYTKTAIGKLNTGDYLISNLKGELSIVGYKDCIGMIKEGKISNSIEQCNEIEYNKELNDKINKYVAKSKLLGIKVPSLYVYKEDVIMCKVESEEIIEVPNFVTIIAKGAFKNVIADVIRIPDSVNIIDKHGLADLKVRRLYLPNKQIEFDIIEDLWYSRIREKVKLHKINKKKLDKRFGNPLDIIEYYKD